MQSIFAPVWKKLIGPYKWQSMMRRPRGAGRGTWTLDGNMIDAPVTSRAKSMVSKDERRGFDIKALREKW